MKAVALAGITVVATSALGCSQVTTYLDEMAEQERLRWQPVTSAVQLEYALPQVVPQDPDRQLQQDGNVSVSVAVPTYEARVQRRETYEPISPATSQAEQRVFMKTTTPSLSVHPQQLSFNIKINNQHERVLRLDGTIVRVNVNGKMLDLRQENYQDFLNGMVLPRQETEFEIAGPSIRELPDKAVIGLFLYDVITRTDAAGNPEQKTNFEWYFVHNIETKTSQEEAVQQRIRLTQAEASAVRAPWPVKAASDTK